MSNSVQPHRRQPTWLPRPRDSPGKNTGVGCHFFLQCMKVKVKTLSHIRLLVTPWTAAYQAPPSMRFSRQKYWSGVPLPSPLLLLLNLKHQKQTNQNCHSCFPMKIIQSCPPSLDFPIGPHPQLALSDRLTLADSYLNRNLAIFMLLHAQLAFPCEISTFHSH